jgi:hypothetical protein
MPENEDELNKLDRSTLQAGDGLLLGVGHEPPNTWLGRASTKLWPLFWFSPHSVPIRPALMDSIISLYYHDRE